MWFDHSDFPFYVPIAAALVILPAVRHVADQPTTSVPNHLPANQIATNPAVAKAIDQPAPNSTFPVIQE